MTDFAVPDDFTDLAERMLALANEIEEPIRCTTPGYGVPGQAHCAACCYGTGYIITSDEDQAMLTAAKALRAAVPMAVNQP